MLHARSNGGLSVALPHATPSVGVWSLIGHSSMEGILTESLAWVIASHCNPQSETFVPALGLDYGTFIEVLNRHFPHFSSPPHWLEAQEQQIGQGGALDEFPDLLQLLLDHCVITDDRHRYVAHLVATACMGGDHLWQDMGLPNRQALSELLNTYFPALAVKNSGDMKWKKFFYKQLCEREGINACKSPSCAACSDYARCFGPED